MINNYKTYKKCRFCKSSNLLEVINLGNMPLAGGFLRNQNEFKNEKKYPLKINYCKNCFLLQTSVSINPDKLFKNYFYFSSKIQTLIDHFNETAKSSKKYLKKGDFVVEVGCNDGEFLKALEKNGYKAVGVDPATNVVKPLIKKGVPIINSYFNTHTANKIVKKYGKADAIYSFHSLAHIPDMHEVMSGVKSLLKNDGYLAFEVHYLGNLLDEMQYDMIYHEHLHYYSLLAIDNLAKQYQMEVFNIERNDQRAGSIIFYLQNMNGGQRKVSKNVNNLRILEKRKKYNKPIPYLSFNKKIKTTEKKLNRVILKLKNKGYKIAGYGASGRGTVIMNYCKLSTDIIDFVVDDATPKHGTFMPGTHNPIFSPTELTNQKIDYAVVFAWPFINEVKKRNKRFLKNGRFIVPLPKVKII